MADDNNKNEGFVKFLPSVFQTSTERKFFDSTFNQVFSKADNEVLSAFLGRRTAGRYNPVSDYYIPEPTKDRTWWQLEATAFARGTDNEKENIFFYDDLLNKINYYGGNTLNQDRLFESEYYSWCPPIDPDMFINYQNYYWIDQRLPAITITGTLLNPITSADIIGQVSYTTPLDATPPGLTLSSGMRIILSQDTPEFQQPHTVDNVGVQGGIRLIEDFPDYVSNPTYEFLPWDGIFQLSTGRIIDNTHWDVGPWEVQSAPFAGDYITIARGAIDRNAWSRTNKWYHVDVINTTMAITGISFPSVATRALRPIIQFNADLQLYNAGSQFKSSIQYGYTSYSNLAPILLSDYQGQLLGVVNNGLGSSLTTGDLVVFFNDTSSVSISTVVNQYIYMVSITAGIVTFIPYSLTTLPVVDGDIVFVTQSNTLINNPEKGQSWFYDQGSWQEVANDKFKTNQPPLFQLYDYKNDSLNSYNDTDFAGNKIFSYKVNSQPGAFVDPVLGFPIVYTILGQASDIVFENNLMTNRYTYESGSLPISGYYYFKHVASENMAESFGNSWNLYTPTSASALPVSRQRVVDRYVVGYNTSGPQTNATATNILKFKLSVIPHGYPLSPDIIVSVNGIELLSSQYTFETINSDLYINLTTYLAGWETTTSNVSPPVVEAHTYTYDELLELKPGYFEIPQQLEANPNNNEIFETSGSELTNQFASIIAAQTGFIGTPFGGDNNYRDTAQNISLGTFILQNTSPLLKTMLVSSSGDLEYFNALRFSSGEYTKFKVKYLRTAQQLINQQFTPAMIQDNNVIISSWFDQIFKSINISKEFSNAFAYSFMAAASNIFAQEEITANAGTIVLSDYLDITDPRNVIYVYNNSTGQTLLLVDLDYTITQSPLMNPEITFNFSSGNVTLNDDIIVSFYQNPMPTYIPSTPSKIGTYAVYEPRIEDDFSYAIPVPVIVGHDGSRTVAKGDYTDDLLLELEKRIYNGIPSKFRNQYNIPLRIEDVKSGYFRTTRFDRETYLDITESYLNKWSAKYSADYRLNEYDVFFNDVDTFAPQNIWMLWNYSSAISSITLEPLNLPGNWKGIFDYYYDTITPDTTPWEMLGFSIQPDWWQLEYGAPIVNTNGQYAWTSTSAGLHILWDDLEDGIIRQGNCATFDPITGAALPNLLWVRPGLSGLLPVDAAGDIRTVVDIFSIALVTPTSPPAGFDDPWVYGDGSPVEQAWMNSSEYTYSINEFLYLMNPAGTGEQYFDTFGTEYSDNGQYVQNDAYLPYDFYVHTSDYFNDGIVGSGDPYFTWMRPRNTGQIVHAESLPDGEITVRFGYQRWISDYLLFLGKDITASFGHRVRTLDINLANKLAGFTNKDTTRTYLESITPSATTTSLLIPTTNFDVRLHVSQPIATYSYSGVIVRALANGEFAVYGYDLLNPEFTVFTRALANAYHITIGGTPATWTSFQVGSSYVAGAIVRYNGVYYQSNATLTSVIRFDISQWTKLAALPITGGVNVTAYPTPTLETVVVPYGTVFANVQDVFSFLLGWGDYLEFQGWKFEDVNSETSEVSNWLYSAKQFLFWINTQWAPDTSIQLSPLANSATLLVANGYPANVEKIANGVYSILDKFGTAINPANTTIDRTNQLITVIPTTLEAGGIYYLQVSATETEHILIFDNSTNFGDVIYDPLYRSRQARLRFNGFRSKNWFGKLEAPGYLIIGDQLLPNYDTLVENVRYYYDPNVTIDNPSAENLGRHLIGYESKSFLDNLEISDDIQYLFYQGVIRQKGTRQAFNKLFRSTSVIGNGNFSSTEKINVYEEWALKLGDFGNTIEQVSTEFKLMPEESTGEVVVARLNYIPDTFGFVKLVNILNAENTYSVAPTVTIDPPDFAYFTAAGVATLSAGSINHITIVNGGAKYETAPTIIITGDGTGASATAIINNGSVTNILVTNAGSGYTTITVSFTSPEGIRQATAFAMLDSFGKISRIEMSDGGFGYTENPAVIITPNTGNVDRVYAIFQGEIIVDAEVDNIVDIDIDETNIWTVRPPEPSYSLVFPTTDNIHYSIPNAGYVNRKDVDWLSFNEDYAFDVWGSDALNPVADSTVWFAQDENEDWDVLKLVQSNYAVNDPFIAPAAATGSSTISSGSITHVAITNGGTGYISSPNVSIVGDGSGAITATATISGGKVTQIMLLSIGAGYTTATVVIDPPPAGITATATAVISDGVVNDVQILTTGDIYLYPPTVSFSGGNGTGAFAIATLTAGVVTDVTVTYGGTGYTSPPDVTFSPPQILSSNSSMGFELIADNSTQLTLSVTSKSFIEDNDITPISLQNIQNDEIVAPGTYLVTTTFEGPRIVTTQWTNTVLGISTTYDVITTWYDYALKNDRDIPLTVENMPDYASLNQILVFKSMRFVTTPVLPAYVNTGDLVWIDRNVDDKWAVYNVDGVDLSIHREQAPLIDTKQFENAQIFSDKNQQELALLPVYDPFKGILPNRAEQNITYKSFQDPARYNVTPDPRLYSQNKMFGTAQVGKLWWDFSTCRYFYYEQPVATTETENDNLIYVRDNWGQLFPGSTVSIYEWTESTVPPAQYTGPGTPRSIDDMVQITSFNSFTNIIESRYYFWVQSVTTQPNLQNRTMPAVEVARMLANPKSQGYAFFAPIQQTDFNNSYMFFNVTDTLMYKGNNVQIQYKTSDRDDQEHAQWGMYREGDNSSLVPTSYWNKFVDSICAYTDVLPITGQYSDSILIGDPPNGKILPVPDPSLSIAEQYGVKIRPRQSMFVGLYDARKIFYQAANSLLINIPIRDINPDWNDNVTTTTYWKYVNWYEVGFENAMPQIQYTTLTDANNALLAGDLELGEVVKVIQGTDEPLIVNKRYALYSVTAVADSSTTYLKLISYELSAIQILPTIYTARNVYQLSTELRELLNAMYANIFVDTYVVDTNLLFFAMLNFVLSEQSHPDWVFKSSYIYIKEENIQLTQTSLFVPNRASNIIGYINDVKPYHTQIRNFVTNYSLFDLAEGTAADTLQHNISIKFGPSAYTGVPYNPGNLFDAEFFASLTEAGVADAELFPDVVTVVASEDNSKIGYSDLYPYTFSLADYGVDYDITNIMALAIDGSPLIYGQDYYVEYNTISNNYTAYLFDYPGVLAVITVYVLIDSGSFTSTSVDPYRNETALGISIDNFVINVDTLLPTNTDGTVFTLWDMIDPRTRQPIGWDEQPWDTGIPETIIYDTDYVISYKENVNIENVEYIHWDTTAWDDDVWDAAVTMASYTYRNNNSASGLLIDDITVETQNNTWPITYTAGSTTFSVSGADVFQDPSPTNLGSVWINGEKISYTTKVYDAGITTFSGLFRGVERTVQDNHIAGTRVFATQYEHMPFSEPRIWNGSIPTTYIDTGHFAHPIPGGVWYALNVDAEFLKDGQGSAT